MGNTPPQTQTFVEKDQKKEVLSTPADWQNIFPQRELKKTKPFADRQGLTGWE